MAKDETSDKGEARAAAIADINSEAVAAKAQHDALVGDLNAIIDSGEPSDVVMLRKMIERVRRK